MIIHPDQSYLWWQCKLGLKIHGNGQNVSSKTLAGDWTSPYINGSKLGSPLKLRGFIGFTWFIMPYCQITWVNLFPLFQEHPWDEIQNSKIRIFPDPGWFEESTTGWESKESEDAGTRLRLVLSCGTDSILCLWRITSVASAPLGAKAGQDHSGKELNSETPMVLLLLFFFFFFLLLLLFLLLVVVGCRWLSLVVVVCCWLLLVVVGRCWLLLVVVRCCWLSLVVVGCCWLLLVVVGCCWLLLVVFGCCWLFLFVFISCWLFLIVVDCCWMLLDVVGCRWLWLVVVGCCWLLLVVVGYWWLGGWLVGWLLGWLVGWLVVVVVAFNIPDFQLQEAMALR